MSWSDVDFEDGSVSDILQEHGFFPYSGADGDLFRKHGLAGWRVSVYGRYFIRIQKKGRPFKGRNTWRTVRQWRTDKHVDYTGGKLGELDAEAISDFEAELSKLVENGELDFPAQEHICQTTAD